MLAACGTDSSPATPAVQDDGATRSRSASSRSSRSTSTTRWSTRPRSTTPSDPDVEVVFGQGKSGTDDEGEIAPIENMITQQVKAIAITPTSPNVQDALDKAVKAGIKVDSGRQRHPGLDRQVVGRRHRQPGRRQARRQVARRQAARRVRRSASCRAGSATRRSTTGSRACSRRRSATKSTVVAEPATDCDQTKGLNAAQDILTANPDITAIYGACGPPIIGALAGDQGGRQEAGE